MIKNDNSEIRRELEIDKRMDSCINDELVNHYTQENNFTKSFERKFECASTCQHC